MSLELIKLKNKEIKFLKDENKVLKKRVEEFESKFKKEQDAHIEDMMAKNCIINNYRNRTCESCKYNVGFCCFHESEAVNIDHTIKDFCCNKWESK